MDYANLSNYFVPIVLIACLVMGCILKNWIEDLDNKYIPTFLTLLGAVLGCVANNAVTLETVVYGALTGLASTGFHQAFKQFIDNRGGK